MLARYPSLIIHLFGSVGAYFVSFLVDIDFVLFTVLQGVWIWGKPIEGFTPDGEPIKVLVLDTEGLGATDEEQNHDVRIFSLAILLASYFIYNS